VTVEERVTVKFHPTCDLCRKKLRPSLTRSGALQALREHRRECTEEEHKCDECGTTMDACSGLILRRGKGCCDACYTDDTHNVTFEFATESLKRADQRRRADLRKWPDDAA
jgi:hypothetical protein